MRDKLELLEQRRAESEQGGGAERLEAQHAKGKLSARERLDLLLDEGSFVEFDRFVTHRSTDFGLGRSDRVRRRRGHRLRPHRRPPRLRLLAGLHRARRLAVRDARREDLQGHGPGRAQRRAGDRAQRLAAAPASRRAWSRWAATPTSSCATRSPRASCRRSPRSSGPAPAARCTRPAITDFIVMVRGTSLHVRHRAQRGEDGHPRGRDHGGAGRRRHARRHVGRGPLRLRLRARVPPGRSATCFRFLPSNNLDDAAPGAPAPIPATAATRPCSTSCPTAPTSRTTCTT